MYEGTTAGIWEMSPNAAVTPLHGAFPMLKSVLVQLFVVIHPPSQPAEPNGIKTSQTFSKP